MAQFWLVPHLRDWTARRMLKWARDTELEVQRTAGHPDAVQVDDYIRSHRHDKKHQRPWRLWCLISVQGTTLILVIAVGVFAAMGVEGMLDTTWKQVVVGGLVGGVLSTLLVSLPGTIRQRYYAERYRSLKKVLDGETRPDEHRRHALFGNYDGLVTLDDRLDDYRDAVILMVLFPSVYSAEREVAR